MRETNINNQNKKYLGKRQKKIVSRGRQWGLLKEILLEHKKAF